MDAERLEYIRSIFKGSLLNLKDTLLMMASLTDRNLTTALGAYLERDDQKALTVEDEDSVIDRLEMDIDDMVVTYLATHGPMATECRMAFCASKISPALESIADQAVSIARRARLLNALPEINSGVDILPMGKTVVSMIRDAINAFVEVRPDQAAPIVLLDKTVDAINRENERLLHRVMAEDTKNIPAYIHLMFISRALERAGDYAKHIAEDVHFLYTAHDIRHERRVG